MNKRTRRILAASITLATGAALLTGCTSDADMASTNLSKAAEQFEVERTIIFYNGITGDYMQTIEGFCSVETVESKLGNSLEVTCKDGPNSYTKDFLGLSDNVTYMALQKDGVDVSLYHRRVLVKPETILPSIDLEYGEQ